MIAMHGPDDDNIYAFGQIYVYHTTTTTTTTNKIFLYSGQSFCFPCCQEGSRGHNQLIVWGSHLCVYKMLI